MNDVKVYKSKYYDSELEKGVEFEYTKELTIQQKVNFVNNVLGVLFSNDYCYSIIKNEVIDIMLVDAFTNILKTDEDFRYTLNDINKFLSTTNVVDILMEEIHPSLYEELVTAIDENISYKTGVDRNGLSTAFSSLLRTIEKKVASFDVDELTNTLKQFGNVASGLSQEEIMDLYTKTDAYKKNYEETLQSKNEEIRTLKELYKENKYN